MSQSLMPKACENCRSKKVRCDRFHPCSNCTRLDNQCIFTSKKSLPRGRAGGRKSQITHLRGRVANLESIIHHLQARSGPGYASVTRETPSTGWPLPRDASSAALSGVDGISTFWTVLTAEISQLQDALSIELRDASNSTDSDEDVPRPSLPMSDQAAIFNPVLTFGLLSYPLSENEHKPHHPPEQLREELIAIFQHNVDPIFKILHAPTLKDQAKSLDSGSASKILQPADNAVLFAVYAAAAMSMTEFRCKQLLGQGRIDAIQQFSRATQTSLFAADLLNSRNLTTLQAFILYLLVLRSVDSGQQQWALIALAVRLARGMNLHTVGAGSKLTSLDREMRCRVWHQLRTIEFQAALDRGDKPDIDEDSYTTPPISNIRDEDVSADSFDFPSERHTVTESTFSVLKQQCVTLCKRLNHSRIENPSHQQMEEEWDYKQRLIRDFEQKLEDIVQHCDESIPLQWYIKVAFEGLTPMFRIMFYRPLWQRSRLRPQPAGKDQLLNLALESLQRESVCASASNAQPYNWHIWVQWYTLAVALAELCVQSRCDYSDSVWDVIERSYAYQSQHIADSKNGKLWKPIKELMKRARCVRKLRASSTPARAQSSQHTHPAHASSMTQSSMSPLAQGVRQDSEAMTFSDDAWMLQQSIMDPSVYDEAWTFWDGFVEGLSAS